MQIQDFNNTLMRNLYRLSVQSILTNYSMN